MTNDMFLMLQVYKQKVPGFANRRAVRQEIRIMRVFDNDCYALFFTIGCRVFFKYYFIYNT